MALAKKVTNSKKNIDETKPNNDGVYDAYTPLDFSTIERSAHDLADFIESKFEDLAHILLEYESYEVVLDETERTLDLLRNIHENKEYFKLRIGSVATFLPRNQPLYALACFVIIPSLMASEVYVRIPHSMKHFYPKMLALLECYERFPNVHIVHSSRSEFLKERSALKINNQTKVSYPVTDVVIFTGTSLHADQLRMVFDQRTLFITNGSGHNPIVVSNDADIEKAVEATLTLQLYNQGQDCAAPNSILVHSDIFTDFLRMIRDQIRTVRVGDYRDRKSRVGPLSDAKQLVPVQDFLIDHRQWLDPTTPGIVRAYDAILEPTIIVKPLAEGGNYNELFAPIIFVQKYNSDTDLADYFNDGRYMQNAMYVTLYGTSQYVQNLIDTPVEAHKGKVIHPLTTFVHNTHLHAAGIERGTQPYGGNGYGSSSISIDGNIIPQPTLPQRDIFEWIAKPMLDKHTFEEILAERLDATEYAYKDVQKIMRLKAESEDDVKKCSTELQYVDSTSIVNSENRYVLVEDENLFKLLECPNMAFATTLTHFDCEAIHELRDLMKTREMLTTEDFKTALYAIAAKTETAMRDKKTAQIHFFKNVYQLLFGKDSGPRLTQFLRDVDATKAHELLDI